MKILAIVHFYLPHCRGGAELMMHSLLTEAVKRGHDVSVVCTKQGFGTMPIDGVKVFYGQKALDRIKPENCDVVITHLLEFNRAYAFAKHHKKKIVTLLHNDNNQSLMDVKQNVDLIVYNTKWLKDKIDKPGIVVHPPVDISKHETKPGNKITLVNLIEPKGSNLFYQLAKRMPSHQFLGVKGGYGNQDIRRLPNVEIINTTTNMKQDVWSKTSVLLMPSSYESYGMVGIEAMCSGIPVIAHPTIGLKESLGSAGNFLDRNKIDNWILRICQLKRNAMKEREAAKQRAIDVSKQTEIELKRFIYELERL